MAYTPTTQEAQDITKQALTKIFQAARSDDTNAMAAYLLYRGNDKARHWQVLADMTIEDDRSHVERIARRIKRYQTESEGYQFEDFFEENDRDGQWYCWTVYFRKGVDRKICHFRFRAVGDTLALGDIDT